MEYKKLMSAAALMAAMSFGSTTASAETLALTNLTNMMSPTPLQTSCATCHTSSTTGALNLFGDAWKAKGGGKPLYTLSTINSDALGLEDSDSDGTINDDELNAGTNPGVAAAGTTTTTAASSSGGGCVTGSVTTPLTMVLAMLTLGFFVRRKKD